MSVRNLSSIVDTSQLKPTSNSTTIGGKTYTSPAVDFNPVSQTVSAGTGKTYTLPAQGGTQSNTVPLTSQIGNHQQNPTLGPVEQKNPAANLTPVIATFDPSALPGKLSTAIQNQGGLYAAVQNAANAPKGMVDGTNLGDRDAQAQALADALVAQGGTYGAIHNAYPSGTPLPTINDLPGGGSVTSGSGGVPSGGFNPVIDSLPGAGTGTGAPPKNTPRLPVPTGVPTAQPSSSPGAAGVPVAQPSSSPGYDPTPQVLAEILRNARTSGTRGYVDMLHNNAPTTMDRQAGMSAPVMEPVTTQRVVGQ